MSSAGSRIDVVKVLEDLVSIDTSVPPGKNYEKIVDYLKALFEDVGCETEKVFIPSEKSEGRKNRVNLLAHKRNPGKPRLIFYSHIDVVPVEGWGGFEPFVEGGKLYGRGAADMKGALPGLLSALGKIEEEKKEWEYDVSVMVTTDEEVGQASQIKYLKKYLEPVQGAYVFNLDADAGFVTIASLGTLQMEIEVKGKSVHSGLAHLGKNAIEDSVSLLESIKELKEKVISRRSKVDANPETGLEKMEGRLNINMIKGGTKENVVPDRCLIVIDRRLIPEEEMEEARKELIGTLEGVEDVEWDLKEVLEVPSYQSESSKVNEIESLIEEVTGESGKYGMMGSCDLYSVAMDWGAEVFGLGVIRPDSNIHGKNEFVRLEDVRNLSEIISEFLTS